MDTTELDDGKFERTNLTIDESEIFDTEAPHRLEIKIYENIDQALGLEPGSFDKKLEIDSMELKSLEKSMEISGLAGAKVVELEKSEFGGSDGKYAFIFNFTNDLEVIITQNPMEVHRADRGTLSVPDEVVVRNTENGRVINFLDILPEEGDPFLRFNHYQYQPAAGTTSRLLGERRLFVDLPTFSLEPPTRFDQSSKEVWDRLHSVAGVVALHEAGHAFQITESKKRIEKLPKEQQDELWNRLEGLVSR